MRHRRVALFHFARQAVLQDEAQFKDLIQGLKKFLWKGWLIVLPYALLLLLPLATLVSARLVPRVAPPGAATGAHGRTAWDLLRSPGLPRLLAVLGCLCARRFRADGGSHKYIAIYHLESAEICASKTWKAAVATPWTARIIPRTSVHLRVPLRRYTRRV